MARLRIALTVSIILAPAAQAHVVKDWDWHLVGGKAKRQLHWCVISSPPLPGRVQDAFTGAEARQWKGWAKAAFDKWTKDAAGKTTG